MPVDMIALGLLCIGVFGSAFFDTDDDAAAETQQSGAEPLDSGTDTGTDTGADPTGDPAPDPNPDPDPIGNPDMPPNAPGQDAGGDKDPVVDPGIPLEPVVDPILGDLHGDAGDNILIGTDDPEAIVAGAGNDDVMAGGGSDDIKGGLGEDAVHGGMGNDHLHGGLGGDLLLGDEGDDTLDGTDVQESNGFDRDEGDTLFGGAGNDMLTLGNGDLGTGGEGMDRFDTGAWINGPAPVIKDYMPDEDRIVVNYNEATTPNPTLAVDSLTEKGETYAVITLEGTEVARVILYGGAPPPLVSEIALVPAIW